MNLRRLYRYFAMVAAGGLVFQTTTGCSDQTIQNVVTAVAPTILQMMADMIFGAST